MTFDLKGAYIEQENKKLVAICLAIFAYSLVSTEDILFDNAAVLDKYKTRSRYVGLSIRKL